MIIVQAIKYKNGWAVSVGIDLKNPHDLPVKIFRDGKVIDPLLYTIAKDEIDRATNKTYVPEEKYEETIREIKKFYEKYGEYHGTNITITVLVSDEDGQKKDSVTVRELKQTPHAHIRKLSIEEILGRGRAAGDDDITPTAKTTVLATVEDAGEIPVV